jgi:hypothetical protein
MTTMRTTMPFFISAALTLSAMAYVPPVLAQAPAPSVRDSTLEALKGRQVDVTSAGGLGVAGELAGFDAETVTIIRQDSKVVVVKRSDVMTLAVATVPAPAPAAVGGGQVHGTPASAAPGSAQPGADATTAAVTKEGWVPLPDVRVPVPYRPGTRSTREDLSAYEHNLHGLSGVTTDYCVNGKDDPKCSKTLTLGAEMAQSKGNGQAAVGIITAGLGIIALGIGGWRLDIGLAAKEAADRCEDLAGLTGITSVCDEADRKATTNLMVGGMLTVAGGAAAIGGAVFSAIGFGNAGKARDYRFMERVAITPIVSPSVAGLTLEGSF